MHQHHQHGHGHHHHHDASSRIGWAFALNVGFTVIEFVGGMLTNSTAIMADAVHDLGDSLAIALAWILNEIGKKDSDHMFTYGYQRFSLMGAFFNSLVLIVGSIWVLSEAIPKLLHPEMPMAEGMFALAILGVAVNGYAAYKLSHGTSLNEKVLNWHLLEDVLGWLAVLIVSVVLLFVDWPILDPVLSIIFTLFILFNVVKTLRDTIHLFLQGTPDRGLVSKLHEVLTSCADVAEVHHLHLWSLDGEHHVLTAHVVVETPIDIPRQLGLKAEIAQALSAYKLAHTTIEIEFADEQCRDGHNTEMSS